MREIERTRCGALDVAWFCVCASCAVQRWGRMNVLFVVVVGESASALGETEGFVWKVADSCRQHACYQVDTYV